MVRSSMHFQPMPWCFVFIAHFFISTHPSAYISQSLVFHCIIPLLYVLFEGYSLLWYMVGFGVLSGCDISSLDGFGVLVFFSFMSNGATICSATSGIHTVDPLKRLSTTATVTTFLTMSSSSTLLGGWTRRRGFWKKSKKICSMVKVSFSKHINVWRVKC